MSQYDPNLHARRLINNHPPEGWDQDYHAPQPPPQQPLYYTPDYTPGQYRYPPVQPPLRKPWSRRHPFLFWLGIVVTALVVSAVIVKVTGTGGVRP